MASFQRAEQSTKSYGITGNRSKVKRRSKEIGLNDEKYKGQEK